MLRLSFILPCYNVAPYIGRCIESIEHQDIPQSEYEVICVDDCSKDNTIDVIKDCQKQYDNIRLICHKENKTAGGARNTGIDAAKGEYIWFVDPDDAIKPDVLQTLYADASTRQTDIFLFNLELTSEKGEKRLANIRKDVGVVCSGQDYVLKYCTQRGLYEVASHVSCVFKHSFLKENNLQYPEIKSSQDVVFVWKAVLSAKKMSAISKICYHVYRRPGSTTGSRGKLSPQAVLSASILYPAELLNLVDTIQNIHSSMKETLINDARMSVNNDSRVLMRMERVQMREFYGLMTLNLLKIHKVRPLMNRKTLNIFNCHIPYFFWQIMVWGYKWYEKLF